MPNGLPSAKEVAQGLPQADGFASGLADCTLNNAMLFEGIVSRLELGLAAPQEERVLQRLLAGFVRLSGHAQNGAIVGGVTLDGHGYYPARGATTAAWAYALYRALGTTALDLDNQQKLRSLGQNVSNMLVFNRQNVLNYFERTFLPGDVPARLTICVLLALAFIASHDKKWRQAAEDEWQSWQGSVLELAEAEAVAAQFALLMLRDIFADDENLRATVESRANELARAAQKKIAAYAQFSPAILADLPVIKWSEAKGRKGFPEKWRRLVHEGKNAAAPALAALTVLLAPQPEIAAAAAPEIQQMLQKIPWEKLWLARALTPLSAIHARGIEAGLWEPELQEYHGKVDLQTPLVTKFMAPDYDAQHPEQAGHAAPVTVKKSLYGKSKAAPETAAAPETTVNDERAAPAAADRRSSFSPRGYGKKKRRALGGRRS
jgi:hypothetical protein